MGPVVLFSVLHQREKTKNWKIKNILATQKVLSTNVIEKTVFWSSVNLTRILMKPNHKGPVSGA